METITALAADLQRFYNTWHQRLPLNNPNFLRRDGCLTWNNRLARYDTEDYVKYYDYVMENVQFSLIIGDGAAVQIYFQCHGTEIAEANLAYIPKPGSGYDYVRLDLDSSRARHYSHTIYHGHLGFNCREMRYPLKHFPYPSQFLKFLAYSMRLRNHEAFDREKFFSNGLNELRFAHNHSLTFEFAGSRH